MHWLSFNTLHDENVNIRYWRSRGLRIWRLTM